jgi:hypothetical protein
MRRAVAEKNTIVHRRRECRCGIIEATHRAQLIDHGRGVRRDHDGHQ